MSRLYTARRSFPALCNQAAAAMDRGVEALAEAQPRDWPELVAAGLFICTTWHLFGADAPADQRR
ncbi:hypothetical protein [Synechococcus sp. CBW1107]|uniref:hypothetical protein n=1 Tax=Synechococcus sp. CBW1107 TaxID=2789857 RepID=UPI002AD2F211|nr:hypothetical protein [Synechococcus sp. CBW1107]CAK6701042.1 hypothetical protein IFHNHDMJ_02989 [Synechococcus sp. CBW1107]